MPHAPAAGRAFTLVVRAWLVIGAALATGVLMLVGYVAAGRWARVLPRPTAASAVSHPYDGLPWFGQYRREFESSLGMHWSPYVYWQRRPFAGAQINVDSLGFRRTIQAHGGGEQTRQLWFFGGSTMWGTWQRDSMTIPSAVARGLAQQGIRDVEVRNFGESGYVFTQELLRLILQLRAGQVPSVVVFYNGANDLAASTMNPSCGLPQNEQRREFEFSLGRLLQNQGSRELSEFARVFKNFLENRANAALVANGRAQPPQLDVNRAVRETIGCYTGTVQVVEALASAYGFRVLYFWQPMPGASPKSLTPYERAQFIPDVRNGTREFLEPLARTAYASIDSAMVPLVGDRYHNIAATFAGDSSAVWIDFVGHITESATQKVVTGMLPPIARALTPSPSVPNAVTATQKD